MRLILASASPRRADLLRAAGFDLEIVPAEVDESLHAGETPGGYVQRLALAKAVRVQELLRTRSPLGDDLPAPAILGADTVVLVDGEILGKPRDAADGRDMLRRLSGRAHDVITGVSLLRGAFALDDFGVTTVHFEPLTEQEIEWYTGSGEGLDKAGGYAIQGLASRFIPRIEGSYSNVVGLPIESVYRLMQELERLSAFLASAG
jgi:septum formation protein